MTKKRIIVTSILPGKIFNSFLNNNDFEIKLLSKEEKENLAKITEEFQPHGIISLLSDNIDKKVLEASKNLKIVANYAVGFNNIDIETAKQLNITITNTPKVLTDATADITMLLILMVTRKAILADSFVRKGKFDGWQPELFTGPSLLGKTIGILGFGRIGRAVAKRAKAFGMNILYYKRNHLLENEEDLLGISYADFDLIIEKSDILSIHLPYTEKNHHLINKEVLNKMKNRSVLINTARGAIVDEKALVNALKNQKLFGAGLDVYEQEPQIEKELLEMENVVLFPHIGSATIETREKMAAMVVDNCLTVLNNEKPKNPVF